MPHRPASQRPPIPAHALLPDTRDWLSGVSLGIQMPGVAGGIVGVTNDVVTEDVEAVGKVGDGFR